MKNECAATGRTCQMVPNGPKGEMQCEFCGAVPVREAAQGEQFEVTDRWKCQCGAEHEFSAYAVAHWRDEIMHTCQNCKRWHIFCNGVVVAETNAMNIEGELQA